MKKIVPFILIITMLFALSGCTKAELPAAGDPLVFDAKVLSVAPDMNNIFVEAEGQENFDKSVIDILSDTEIVDSDGNVLEFDDIKKGDLVTITNYGLIAESYPAQMSAQKIVITTK